jgi:hypothetical protein
MSCLSTESLIGILKIKYLNAEERTVARSHGIFSIPDRVGNLLASQLYYIIYISGKKRQLALSSSLYYIICTSDREIWLALLMRCELCILFLLLNKEHAKAKCRSPPNP